MTVMMLVFWFGVAVGVFGLLAASAIVGVCLGNLNGFYDNEDESDIRLWEVELKH
jgi:hypothetical protein